MSTTNYTRWEIGGEPQPNPWNVDPPGIIPDGRSGGNRNASRIRQGKVIDYTRWEIGGEPQRIASLPTGRLIIPDGRSGGNRNARNFTTTSVTLYPMGDRGGTATVRDGSREHPYYTRWEIGGEPQHPNGVSMTGSHYTRWEIGGEPQR